MKIIPLVFIVLLIGLAVTFGIFAFMDVPVSQSDVSKPISIERFSQ